MDSPGGEGAEMVVISEKYGLSASPGGTVYSTFPAQTLEEEEEQQRQFLEYLREQGIGQEYEPATFVMDGLKMELQKVEAGEEEDEDEAPLNKGRKRGNHRFYRCNYAGCDRRFSTAPLTCPHPSEAGVELEQHFCSYPCMSAWADYEIGHPLCERLHALIEQRAGHAVVSAPPPSFDRADQLEEIATQNKLSKPERE
jgi:hypothetical protein